MFKRLRRERNLLSILLAGTIIISLYAPVMGEETAAIEDLDTPIPMDVGDYNSGVEEQGEVIEDSAFEIASDDGNFLQESKDSLYHGFNRSESANNYCGLIFVQDKGLFDAPVGGEELKINGVSYDPETYTLTLSNTNIGSVFDDTLSHAKKGAIVFCGSNIKDGTDEYGFPNNHLPDYKIRLIGHNYLTLMVSGCSKDNSEPVQATVEVVQDNETSEAEGRACLFRKYLESIRTVRKETVSDPGAEQYKKDFYLLMADFMSGGFTTNQNLDYLNNEYPQEFYCFCIEDLNGDSVPEFMLGYGYNGEDPTYWEIFKTGNSYDECYVGAVMYFDRENGILFDSYGSDMYAYIFDGEKLTRKFSYYMDGEECREDASSEDGYVQKYYYEDESLHKWELTEQTYNRKLSGYYDKENIRFEGKRLTPENLADDLGIDRNSWEKERALRSYLGILHYFSKHTDCDYMKDFRYALVNIDNDDIPEMVAVNNGRMDLFFYRNGRWLRQSGSDTDDGDVHHFSFFPRKNIYKSSTSDWGNRQEEFYTIRDELTECMLVAREEVLESAFDNGFQRDSDGKLLYNYCVNENIVTEREYMAVKAALYDVFDLGEEVRFEDMESFFYQDMMTYLEKQTGYYYR